MAQPAQPAQKGQQSFLTLQVKASSHPMNMHDAVLAAMEQAQETAKKPPEPGSPPRKYVAQKAAEAISPSKGAADLLQRALSITPAPFNQRPVLKQTLSQLLDAYQLRFWDFIKANTSKPEIRQGNVRIEALIALTDVFVSLKNRNFLDTYVQSLASDELPEEFTAFDRKLNHLKLELEKVGIQGFKEGELPVFWSGPEAQARAAAEKLSNPSIKTDSDIPLFKVLFDCWGYVKGQKHELTKELVNMLPILFSVMFAKSAEGEVNIYVSSKNNEIDNVFNVDSAAWTELFVLLQNRAVTQVYLHQHLTGDRWADPIDIKSEDPREIAVKDQSVHLSKRGEKMYVSIEDIKEMVNCWRRNALGALDGSSNC